jgi:hypothetical protein
VAAQVEEVILHADRPAQDLGPDSGNEALGLCSRLDADRGTAALRRGEDLLPDDPAGEQVGERRSGSAAASRDFLMCEGADRGLTGLGEQVSKRAVRPPRIA